MFLQPLIPHTWFFRKPGLKPFDLRGSWSVLPPLDAHLYQKSDGSFASNVGLCYCTLFMESWNALGWKRYLETLHFTKLYGPCNLPSSNLAHSCHCL